MLCKKIILVAPLFIFFSFTATAQKNPVDTISPVHDESLGIDTLLDYDDLLSEFDSFLDSILAPRSYFLVAASAGTSYFNFKKTNNTGVDIRKKLVLSPVIGYYHKSGLGLTMSGNMINDGNKRSLYQAAISPSFDFIQSRNFIGGITYTKFINKDSVSFYTSPVENEVSAYFIARKPWLQPGIAVGYSWGSRTEYEKRVRFLQRLGVFVPVVTTKEESVSDFSMTASLRHNFYWLNISKNTSNYVKLTPILAMSAGTQKFGSNQSTAYGFNFTKRGTVTYNTPNVNLEDELKFQPLSLTLYLRPEYATKHFFIQPQLLFDYYFPEAEKKFTTLFSVNAGFLF
ncbi:MAG: hypothetical protein WDN26_02680 [Chitinophagaceae bacterium]